MIPNIQVGLFIPNPDDGQKVQTLVSWPEGIPVEQDLIDANNMARTRNASVISEKSSDISGAVPNLIIACPLLLDEQIGGVIAIKSATPMSQQNVTLQLLKWGGAWLHLLDSNTKAAISTFSLLDSDELLSLVECSNPEVAATTTATTLSRKLECERVSIGLLTGNNVRVFGLSHSTKFDSRSNLLQQIVAVMEEALRESDGFQHTTNTGDTSDRLIAHQQLVDQDEGNCVYSFPLRYQNQAVGVMVLERTRPLTALEIDCCEKMSPIVGSLLERMRLQEQGGKPSGENIPVDFWYGWYKKKACCCRHNSWSDCSWHQ